jgi:hypothetical protein
MPISPDRQMTAHAPPRTVEGDITPTKEAVMENPSDRTFERLGAASGLAAVILLLALFTVFPALPAPDEPIGAIARTASTETHALLAGAYVGALLTGALLIFGASVSARLRRFDPGRSWWILAAIGTAGTAVGIVGNALEITFVRAVGHGATGDALWLAYGTDHWIGVLTAVPLSVLLLGAGLGGRVSGALPKWLGTLAVGLAPAFLVGAGSVTGDEVDGGGLGVVLVLAYLGLLVWISGASIVMLRRPAASQPVRAALGTARS